MDHYYLKNEKTIYYLCDYFKVNFRTLTIKYLKDLYRSLRGNGIGINDKTLNDNYSRLLQILYELQNIKNRKTNMIYNNERKSLNNNISFRKSRSRSLSKENRTIKKNQEKLNNLNVNKPNLFSKKEIIQGNNTYCKTKSIINNNKDEQTYIDFPWINVSSDLFINFFEALPIRKQFFLISKIKRLNIILIEEYNNNKNKYKNYYYDIIFRGQILVSKKMFNEIITTNEVKSSYFKTIIKEICLKIMTPKIFYNIIIENYPETEFIFKEIENYSKKLLDNKGRFSGKELLEFFYLEEKYFCTILNIVNMIAD